MNAEQALFVHESVIICSCMRVMRGKHQKWAVDLSGSSMKVVSELTYNTYILFVHTNRILVVWHRGWAGMSPSYIITKNPT